MNTPTDKMEIEVEDSASAKVPALKDKDKINKKGHKGGKGAKNKRDEGRRVQRNEGFQQNLDRRIEKMKIDLVANSTNIWDHRGLLFTTPELKVFNSYWHFLMLIHLTWDHIVIALKSFAFADQKLDEFQIPFIFLCLEQLRAKILLSRMDSLNRLPGEDSLLPRAKNVRDSHRRNFHPIIFYINQVGKFIEHGQTIFPGWHEKSKRDLYLPCPELWTKDRIKDLPESLQKLLVNVVYPTVDVAPDELDGYGPWILIGHDSSGLPLYSTTADVEGPPSPKSPRTTAQVMLATGTLRNDRVPDFILKKAEMFLSRCTPRLESRIGIIDFKIGGTASQLVGILNESVSDAGVVTQVGVARDIEDGLIRVGAAFRFGDKIDGALPDVKFDEGVMVKTCYIRTSTMIDDLAALVEQRFSTL
jgi:hypothetical protein